MDEDGIWMGSRRGRAIALVVAVVALAGLLASLVLGGGDPEGGVSPRGPLYEAPQVSADAPNLLVVMVDDQSVSSFDRVAMPRTHELLDEGGTYFDQAIAAAPLCCPARAGFLTGRYSHNHEVVENTLGYSTMAGKDRTFPVALQTAGYRTGMIGKFLNGYEPFGAAEPAPGFDRWFAVFGSADYFDFQVSDDGELREEAGYSTEVLTSEAIDFAADSTADDDPFFLWLSLNAPHTVPEGSPPPCDGTNAQPPDAGAYEAFADEELRRPPSFDERDVSDKPSLRGGPGRLDSDDIAEISQAWRCARAALASVDEQTARLVDAIDAIGELESTVVVYLSDNGFFYGEHRLRDDKRLPLEPALRIPLAVRVGADVGSERAEPPARVPTLVSQVDLAPTLLDYAGVDPCEGRGSCTPMDGRSLRPLLEGREGFPSDRAIPFSLAEGWTYDALRTPTELYMELDATRYATFDEAVPELYDLDRDPDQLDAISSPSDPRVRELSKRLEGLAGCAGIEGRDQPTAGAPFCE